MDIFPIEHYVQQIKNPVLDEKGNTLYLPRGIAWSHSALGRFEACPLMYSETNVKKTYPYTENQAMIDGKVTHEQLERYVSAGADVPLMLKPITALIDKVGANAVEIIPERDINYTWYLHPCGVFHDDISYRGRIDITFIQPDHEAIIFDYKTGRNPDDPDEQIQYQALALLLEKPKLRKVHGAYVYTKHPRRWIEPVSRKDISRLVRKMLPRLDALKRARETSAYPVKPGKQCNWCPVITCRHNESRR